MRLRRLRRHARGSQRRPDRNRNGPGAVRQHAQHAPSFRDPTPSRAGSPQPLEGAMFLFGLCVFKLNNARYPSRPYDEDRRFH